MLKLIHVIGARPNYMKVAPIYRALLAYPSVEQMLIHTGQHYGEDMSDQFFRDLGIPKPSVNLEVGSGSHANQTGKIMQLFEPVLLEQKPDMVLVVGDVNSTIACALTAKKLGIQVAHVEAGLRSFDMAMPEEINRILTDRISDLLFTTEASGNQNLAEEGVKEDKIHFVGNVMIDSLVHNLDKAQQLDTLTRLGLEESGYLLVTMHRPSNVDDPLVLERMVDLLLQAAERLPLLLPLHPRTLRSLEATGLDEKLSSTPNVTTTEPLGYLEFLRCQMGARAILTDSGGIQEESTFLGIPCLTMRENTERPATITHGTNQLIGTEPRLVLSALDKLLSAKLDVAKCPPLWDGQAAGRIAEVLAQQG